MLRRVGVCGRSEQRMMRCVLILLYLVQGVFSALYTLFLYPIYMEFVRELFERIGADPIVHGELWLFS